MKKIFSVVLACALLCACVFTLASCGGISGTYENVTFGVSTTYKFSGNKVTVKNELLGDFETVYSYEIEKDGDKETLVLTVKEYVYDGEETSVKDFVDGLQKELDESEKDIVEKYAFEKGDGFIKIDGVKYEKK